MKECDNLNESSFNSPILKCGQLIIDLKCRKVTIADKKINLSTREFNLLYFLEKHPGWVFTYDELYRFVWGEEPVNCKNSVMCCISQVRKKIELNSRYPKYIHTVRDVAYKFELLPED